MGKKIIFYIKKNRKLIPIFFIISVCCLVIVISEVHNHYKNKLWPIYVAPVFNMKPNEIISINISPISSPKTHNLVTKTIVIKNKDFIYKICNSLSEADCINTTRAFSTWKCILTICTKEKNYEFEVGNIKDLKGEVMIYFYSDTFPKWSLGNCRLYSLGSILESIIENEAM